MVKHLPTMQETRVQSLGQEDLLEREMASHSSILAWKIPWTEQPGRLYSMGSQRVRHDQATSLSFFSFSYFILVCFPWSLFPNPFSLLVTHYNIIHVLSVYASPEILCVTQYTWVKLHYKYQHRSFFHIQCYTLKRVHVLCLICSRFISHSLVSSIMCIHCIFLFTSLAVKSLLPPTFAPINSARVKIFLYVPYGLVKVLPWQIHPGIEMLG